MKELQLAENLWMYMFEPDKGRVLGQNIFVVYHEQECIVFDAGYEKHMTELIPKLKDFKIVYVICTHFHPDHCFGLNVLPKQCVIGSIHAQETLSMFEVDQNPFLKPEILVEDEKKILFYDHVITLKSNPGHSSCGLLIDIDGKYLMIGDESMSTNEGKPVLPYVAETTQQHIDSLIYISNHYDGYTYLPSHGVKTMERTDLEYRIRYLSFVLKDDPQMDHFYQRDDTPFLCEEWHLSNIGKNNH